MIITESRRTRPINEIAYWDSVDRGENIIPPVPCRECGLVWVHHPRCVCNAIIPTIRKVNNDRH